MWLRKVRSLFCISDLYVMPSLLSKYHSQASSIFGRRPQWQPIYLHSTDYFLSTSVIIETQGSLLLTSFSNASCLSPLSVLWVVDLKEAERTQIQNSVNLFQDSDKVLRLKGQLVKGAASMVRDSAIMAPLFVQWQAYIDYEPEVTSWRCSILLVHRDERKPSFLC